MGLTVSEGESMALMLGSKASCMQAVRLGTGAVTEGLDLIHRRHRERGGGEERDREMERDRDRDGDSSN